NQIELFGLLFHLVHNSRMAVSLVNGGISRQEVVVFISFGIPDMNAFAPGDNHGQRLIVMGSEFIFKGNCLFGGSHDQAVELDFVRPEDRVFLIEDKQLSTSYGEGKLTDIDISLTCRNITDLLKHNIFPSLGLNTQW